MFFYKGETYAKVWKISKKTDKYMDLRISTSEKKPGSEEWLNSSWFPRVIGHAFNSLKDELQEGDRIVIRQAKFSNTAYTDRDGNKKSSFELLILDAEKVDGNNRPTQTPVQTAQEPAADDQNLPW